MPRGPDIDDDHISFSSIEMFKSCPYRYKLTYIDKLHTYPEYDRADNALYLGSTIHRAIEINDIKTAIYTEYFNTYPVISDLHVDEALKMELILEKTIPLIPKGQHEVKLYVKHRGINFLGYIDLLTEDGDIIDFKYSNQVDYYLKSSQLSIYKYFAEILGYKIRDLYFLFIPKLNIKRYQDETIQQYRNRIIEESKKLSPCFHKMEYKKEQVEEFYKTIDRIKNTKEFVKLNNCFFCGFKKYCESKGEINYMILPENKRRDITKVLKRKLWMYGAPFSGKTSFLDKCPDPLSLNTDGNINFVSMAVVPIKDEVKTDGRLVNRKFAWEVFKEAIEELEKHQNDFKTIIIDLVDDIREYCRVYLYDKLKIQHESDAGFGKGYDIIKTEFLSTMKRFFNLPYENLVIVSHEDTSKDITKKSGQNITKVKPNIQEAIANKLAGMVDIVARVVVEEDGTRTLNFKSDEVIFGGGRLKGIKTTKIPLLWDELVKVYDDVNKNADKNADKNIARNDANSNENNVNNNEKTTADANADKSENQVRGSRI